MLECTSCNTNNTITMVRGDTKELQISITNEDGTPYVMNDGDKLYMDVKSHTYDNKPVFRKIIVPDEDNNLIFVIYPSDTADLTSGTYRYDIRLKIDDDHIYTVIPSSELMIFDNITDLRNMFNEIPV